ncbi:excinuclease ABC subunit UvrC [Nitrosococcus oceani]|uniref:excinuclease ABC subunit UvrC n=1 Tax=Nitrosococcus oceani TaxID=1229 RepID=UPI0004E8B664|nr:excinuclease ABC subunit UvrC [Nitrosococcus oceani]KFI22691.1 excinuclease ABC subunit C [Nitrosococcus oceani]
MANFDIDDFLRNLTPCPGVYRMLDAKGKVLYVGKAKNLKRRIKSYFRNSKLAPKIHVLVKQICDIKITVTHTENEALILESNLIKALQPRYNVLLRDDKSYPYIFLSADDFPRLGFHRGVKQVSGQYFGPYPNIRSVWQTLKLLQRVFPVRQCEDNFYRNRSRPCLQYQIKRCTAPCVGLISKKDYSQDIQHVVMFLKGRDQQVINELVIRMEEASGQLAFEQAAYYRDRIASLRQIQARQYISGEKKDIDVLGVALTEKMACVEVFFIRGGHNLGNKTFLPKLEGNLTPEELLSTFIAQYYLNRETPPILILSHQPKDMGLLTEVLSKQAGRKIALIKPVRGPKVQWIKMALANAKINLNQHLAEKSNITARFKSLQQLLSLANFPQRIECFDVSHIQGTATVASCVVFDREGPRKADYRRFNIKGIIPGDDYGALRQALMRRFKKKEGVFPDLLVIDGGKGQINQSLSVLKEIGITEITVLGIAKGPERKAGNETLFLAGYENPIMVTSDSPALHILQHIRDEAHRFAIVSHRKRRAKGGKLSLLEGISGLGPKRRRKLLIQLGGLQEITRAGVEDLAQIEGISLELAQRIYDVFHR